MPAKNEDLVRLLEAYILGKPINIQLYTRHGVTTLRTFAEIFHPDFTAKRSRSLPLRTFGPGIPDFNYYHKWRQIRHVMG